MRINSIKNGEVEMTLKCGELIDLGNIMYDYEQRCNEAHAKNKLDAQFHEMSAQIVTARDVCQYGHLDSHSLSVVMRHRAEAAKGMSELPVLSDDEKQVLCSYLEGNDFKTACGNSDFRQIMAKILGEFIPEGNIYTYLHDNDRFGENQ